MNEVYIFIAADLLLDSFAAFFNVLNDFVVLGDEGGDFGDERHELLAQQEQLAQFLDLPFDRGDQFVLLLHDRCQIAAVACNRINKSR